MQNDRENMLNILDEIIAKQTPPADQIPVISRPKRTGKFTLMLVAEVGGEVYEIHTTEVSPTTPPTWRVDAMVAGVISASKTVKGELGDIVGVGADEFYKLLLKTRGRDALNGEG